MSESLEGLEFIHSYLLEAADPERHVAILSRIPFARVTPHAEIEFEYLDRRERVKRGLLEVGFESANVEWTLFVVHLKSRYTDREDDPMSATRRMLEARAVRDVILDRFPRPDVARFLIAGDCNDTTDSKPLAALQRRGKTVITQPIPARDSRGETWTHCYRVAHTYSRVDFLLSSPGLWPCISAQRGVIYDGAGTLEGSDHRIVYVDLEFDPQPAVLPFNEQS